MLCLFRWKILCKDSFLHFTVFASTKKTWLMENYFWSTENPNKNKAYFLYVVFQFFFWKTISLSSVASPINIILVYSCGKHNFLAPSLSRGKLSHFFSLPFAFSLLTPLLSLTLVYPLPIDLSLSNCLSSLFSPCFSSLL